MFYLILRVSRPTHFSIRTLKRYILSHSCFPIITIMGRRQNGRMRIDEIRRRSGSGCCDGRTCRCSGTKVIVGPDGEPVTGTMVDRGNWNSTELAAGASVTIPAGRHAGSGKVTAKSLAAQTGGATATDQYVKSGMTYWKDGVKRTGTMTVSSVVSF